MFLRKEIRKVKTNNFRQVSFCKDCNSNEIETIQTCKKCGSHNIGFPSFTDLCNVDEKRGIIPIYENKEFYIYTCDNCGKEFNGLEISNIISYGYDEFLPYNTNNTDYKTYTLPKDLCDDCKKALIDKLNKQLEEITNKDNVLNMLDNL